MLGMTGTRTHPPTFGGLKLVCVVVDALTHRILIWFGKEVRPNGALQVPHECSPDLTCCAVNVIYMPNGDQGVKTKLFTTLTFLW